MDAVNAVECPDPLLGTFIYNITDSTGTYCGGVDTTTVNACDAATERTHVHVITEETDSTYLSYIAGDCESGQTATTLLTGGATMILTKQDRRLGNIEEPSVALNLNGSSWHDASGRRSSAK
ncbi:hypothetical protein MAR_033570 [Mya arenaria]|uniref:Uncharacterized protein n=1 Tax=Mya arenaria TaxID=6604 RepID=A0ABY7GCQ2_MYAAR|nr:hypothetical protein MAR_033570 [Mya arenaria]